MSPNGAGGAQAKAGTNPSHPGSDAMAAKPTKKVAVKKSVSSAAQPAKAAKKSAAKKSAANAAPPGKTSKSSEALSASARIDRLIESVGDWRGERLAEIRKLIHETDPAVVEDWK